MIKTLSMFILNLGVATPRSLYVAWFWVVAIGLTGGVGAEETAGQSGYLLSGFASAHLNATKHYRENNYGIGYRNPENYIVGYYRNSNDNDSVYVMKEWSWQAWGPVHVGVLVGGVTGYNVAVQPAILPEIVYKRKNIEFAFTGVPPMSSDRMVVMAAQARISLDVFK